MYFTENAYNIGTQAALLAGFSFSALMQAASLRDLMTTGLQAGWVSVTILSMTFEIMALVKSTQLAISGPGLALRGPEGSMTRAISVMRIEYRKIGQYFYLGLIFMWISSAIFCGSVFEPEVAVLTAVLILGALVHLYFDLRAISKQLQYESVTGAKVRGISLVPIAVRAPGACFGNDSHADASRPTARPTPRAPWRLGLRRGLRNSMEKLVERTHERAPKQPTPSASPVRPVRRSAAAAPPASSANASPVRPVRPLSVAVTMQPLPSRTHERRPSCSETARPESSSSSSAGSHTASPAVSATALRSLAAQLDGTVDTGGGALILPWRDLESGEIERAPLASAPTPSPAREDGARTRFVAAGAPAGAPAGAEDKGVLGHLADFFAAPRPGTSLILPASQAGAGGVQQKVLISEIAGARRSFALALRPAATVGEARAAAAAAIGGQAETISMYRGGGSTHGGLVRQLDLSAATLRTPLHEVVPPTGNTGEIELQVHQRGGGGAPPSPAPAAR